MLGRGTWAPLHLVLARARHRPSRWLLPVLGIAVATAFAAGVAVQGTIAADHAARNALSALTPLQRTVSVTWQGPLTPAVPRQAQTMLDRLGLTGATRVVLLAPVRLSGVVVRPAAVAPLDPWLGTATLARRLGACRPSGCPMVQAGPGSVPSALDALGVRIRVVGRVPLRSAVPLGFAPAYTTGTPVLLSGDTSGLDDLPGLSGVYRTHSWVAVPSTSRLHSWQLASFEARLQATQAGLLARGSQFSVTGPFPGLDAARTAARAAPRRLLLAAGGALAALALFLVLAAGALRGGERAELERLRRAGARPGQRTLFLAGEAGAMCAAGLGLGAAGGILAGCVLAGAAGEPTGAVLSHSLVVPGAAVALVVGWAIATTLVALAVVVTDARLADALAVGSLAALIALVATADSGRSALAAGLAPLACLAAGLLVFRVAGPLLRLGERVARRGPLLVRLALVGLARDPGLPALAVAFVAVSMGLGGFALAYRATLSRGAADQAANAVPLDALVGPASDFTTPLELAPLSRWAAAAGAPVFPVRRTEAGLVNGSGTVTVPALGVPADALSRLHGWRASDGSAPLAELARRLRPRSPVRRPGPALPAGGELALDARSPGVNLTVTADLREPSGAITRLTLGVAGARARRLHARLPAQPLELEGFELTEPVGLDITNGHQNGENVAAATQFTGRVRLGPTFVTPPGSAHARETRLGEWTAVGAMGATKPAPGGAALTASFQTTGFPGVVRPRQPSDARPVPVLIDPASAAAAGSGGLLALSVDGLPVNARIVGVLRRFPTVDPSAAGFIVADESTLSAALEAQLPGQGAPDELWIASRHLEGVHALLHQGRFTQLSAAFRGTVQQRLAHDPITRGVLGTLLAAAVLAAVLAALGLIVVVRGALRDARIEEDLAAQGFGPRWLRRELRMRLLLAGVLGLVGGLVIALVLTGLAADAVRAGYVSPPVPGLVAVIPWGELGAAALGALVVLALLTGLAGGTTGRGEPGRRRSRPLAVAPVEEAGQ
jgi:hypothetical protein